LFLTGGTALASPAQPVRAGAHGTVPYVVESRTRLLPNDALTTPVWWHGVCDGNSQTGNYPGSTPLGAVFDGLVACGRPPGDSNDALVQFFPGAWGEFEWECVELSMRWMYQAWGVEPYGANGYDVVQNYPNGATGFPRLDVVQNGTPGIAPQIGDVLSMKDSSQFGHTEVVALSTVNSAGNGSLLAITENYGNGNDGWIPLTVTHWVVSSPGMSVTGWLHNPAWSLQIPVLWRITTAGLLQVKDSGGMAGSFTTVASGIASADVIGGEGSRPAPLVAALTTDGTLLAGYLLPGTALHTIASGVKSFGISSGAGSSGRPILGWLTTAGDFEIASGSLTATPVLEATGASQIAIAPDSGPSDPVIGYLTPNGHVEVAEGATALRAHADFIRVASGAGSQIALAGGGRDSSDVVEGYVGRRGGFYERQGLGGFARVAPSASQISLGAVGLSATPLLGYVSPAGHFEAKYGDGAWVAQGTGIRAGTVSGGPSSAGFPVVTALSTSGTWAARQGTLSAVWHDEGSGVVAMGASALTVS
jgi:hypothetical protein